jgi:hypothetical protein
MRRLSMIVVVALAAVFATAPVAQAGSHERDTARELRAFAAFTHRDGHVVTQLMVYVVTGDATEGAEFTELPAMEVNVAKYNSRTERMIRFAYDVVPIPDTAAAIDPKLGSATVRATLRLRDEVTGEPLRVIVEVAWTSWGERVTTRDRSVIDTPDGRLVSQQRTTWLSEGTAEATMRTGTDVTRFVRARDATIMAMRFTYMQSDEL